MKLAVIGRGTAGAQTIAHLQKHMGREEIEWHFDPNIPTQAVGEGSTRDLPNNLFYNLDFDYNDLDKIDGSVKTGVYKSGWGKNLPNFIHSFVPGDVSLHFNAKSLQNYVLDKLKDKVKIVEHNITADEIDADYIIDCSGVPKELDEFHIPKYITINSAHVTQCYWDAPRFTHTLAIARPYGWVFGIPLQNRCSIGYMYNKDFNTLEEVKEDVKNVFKEYNLNPSNETNSFTFKNYYRKQNFTNRVAYSGNASFFLEPLEATSVSCMDMIQRSVWDILNGVQTVESMNQKYIHRLESIERMIMLHYFSGSNWDTDFWKYAQSRGEQCMIDSKFNKEFVSFCNPKGDSFSRVENTNHELGTWPMSSYYQNINSLGIKEKLHAIQR